MRTTTRNPEVHPLMILALGVSGSRSVRRRWVPRTRPQRGVPRRIPCIFLVADEVACEVRVLKKSASANGAESKRDDA